MNYRYGSPEQDRYRRRTCAPPAARTVLSRALRQLGIAEDLRRYEFVRHWSEIVGHEIAKRTKPECLRGGMLLVRVQDSVWAQELSFHQDLIIRRVNAFHKSEQLVKSIRFSIGDL